MGKWGDQAAFFGHKRGFYCVSERMGSFGQKWGIARLDRLRSVTAARSASCQSMMCRRFTIADSRIIASHQDTECRW